MRGADRLFLKAFPILFVRWQVTQPISRELHSVSRLAGLDIN